MNDIIYNQTIGCNQMRVPCSTLYKGMVFLRILLLLIIFFQPCLSYGQNVVFSISGRVLVDNKPVKKGDKLSDNQKIVFDSPNSEIKVLSKLGVCVIKDKDSEQKKTSELLELIKSSIRKNSVATLGTRAWKVNPDKNKQIELVEAICKTLDITPDNINEKFSQYITPYCVLEFEKPYWQDIAQFLQTKYGFNPAQYTGELMTPEEYQNIPMVPQVRSLKPIPSAVSLKKYCPIPGYQGKYGTCTGWASAYGARTISWAIRNNLTDVQDITNQAFSPSFVYTQVKGKNDVDCQNGSYIDKSVEVMKDKGAVFLTDLPYECNPDITPFLKVAKGFTIKDFQRLTTHAGIKSENDFNNIKKALADNKPVICSIRSSQSFSSTQGKTVWNGDLSTPGDYHAVCLIGYDDNFDNGDGTFGAVELMNSWSTLWGDGGFIHIKYQDLPKILDYAVSLYDDARPVPPPEPPKPLPNPIPEPDTLKRMEGSFILLLSDGTSMQLQGDEAAFRGLRLANVENMTYNIMNSYPAGTMFRINITSSRPAYVYVISTDSKRSPLAQLFPDPEGNNSALLDFSSEVSVSIPNETQYIQMDETSGEDYMCVIYSKDELDIHAIENSFQNNSNESFVKIVKKALADKIVADNEVVFQKNKIAFNAASATHTAVPIFIKIKHK